MTKQEMIKSAEKGGFANTNGKWGDNTQMKQ